jgi:hypothetical protein
MKRCFIRNRRRLFRRRGAISVFTLAFCLTACVGDSDIYPVPVFPGGGSGSGGSTLPAPPPAEPMVPPVMTSESEQPGEPIAYEQHGATSVSQCQKMAERFKREGRNVRLVKAVPNTLNKGGGDLRYICLFDGPDKVTEGNVFEDYRYNSPDEYNSP